MKALFIIALLLPASSFLTTVVAGQTSIECSSTRKGDESLTVCTGPNRWKSVLRCTSSGCTSKTEEDIDYTAERLKEDEQLREICKLEIAQTMKGQQINYRPSYCERLSTSDSIFGNPENQSANKELEERSKELCTLEKQTKKKSLFDTGCMEYEWAKNNRQKQEENHRLNLEVLAMARDRDDTLRLQLCAKGLFEKSYCEEVRKRVDAQDKR